MTERWRKKLEGIDGASPSDDVFERAKQGSMHRDEALPGPRMSTRVVTIVAAFLVFALAISAFAIPALRMSGTTAGDASLGMFPLWPVQTPDALLQLQARADAGEADWALDPTNVATRFGADVLGWDWTEASPAYSKYCGSEAAVWQPSWLQTTGPSESPVECIPQPTPGPSGAPTPVVGSFPVLDLAHCSGDVCVGGAEYVQVFQPLEQGPGQVWAVLAAWAPGIQLSVAAGQSVHAGASIDALYAGYLNASGSGSRWPTVAFATCGTGVASMDGAYGELTTAIRVLVHVGDATCSGPTPGYAWAVLAASSFVGPDSTIATDPLSETPTSGIAGLTAAPIVVEFSEEDGGTSTSPTPEQTTSPTAEPSTWTRYDGGLGFTMELPTDWGTTSIPDEIVVNAPEGDPYIQINRVDDPPRDDSSFPLNFADYKGDHQPHFYGDGQTFIIQWLTGTPDPLTPEQSAVVERIVESIRFELWKVGETRNGFTAVGEILPASSAEWITFQGWHYIASNVGRQRWLYGPAPDCASGTGTYEVRETGMAGISCPDGSGGDWDFATGEAQPGNKPPFDSQLAGYGAVRSWDGMLLANLPPAGA